MRTPVKEVIERITTLQINLRAEVARQVEHGATRQDTYEAMSDTILDKFKTHVSPAWLAGINRSTPRSSSHASISRITAVEALLSGKHRIWSSAAHGTN